MQERVIEGTGREEKREDRLLAVVLLVEEDVPFKCDL